MFQLTRPPSHDHKSSTQPRSALTDQALSVFWSRFAPRVLGVDRWRDRPLPQPTIFPPHVLSRHHSVTHYGVMIPDLPEPHRFMACAAILGSSGLQVWDNDFIMQDTPQRTATLCQGTAATTHEGFSSYSIPRDCEFRADGSLLRFGDDLEISGLYPNFQLCSRRPGFGIDLELTATGEHTVFTRSFLYDHLSLMTRYQGTITHNNLTSAVSGLCTFEYAAGRSPHVLRDRPLRCKIPIDFFTYQVIDIDDDTQLLLVQLSAQGHPLGTAAWLRTAGKGSVRLGREVDFQVLSYQAEPHVAPDGRLSTIAETFVWTVRDNRGRCVLELIGTIDTQLHYGAGRGYIGGYHYQAVHEGRPMSGRGYVEYCDGREPR